MTTGLEESKKHSGFGAETDLQQVHLCNYTQRHTYFSYGCSVARKFRDLATFSINTNRNRGALTRNLLENVTLSLFVIIREGKICRRGTRWGTSGAQRHIKKNTIPNWIHLTRCSHCRIILINENYNIWHHGNASFHLYPLFTPFSSKINETKLVSIYFHFNRRQIARHLSAHAAFS